MITTFFKIGKKDPVTKLEEFVEKSWIYVEAPTEEELELLVEDLQLDRDLVHDAIDLQEVPRIEIEDGVPYIFTKFVYTDVSEQIQTAPMLIIIQDKYLISISPVAFPKIAQFLEGKVSFLTSDKEHLLVTIFSQINDTYNSHINIISKKVRRLGVNVEKVRNKDIVQFVNFENILSDLNFALVRINAIFTQIATGKKFKFSENERELINDLNLDNEQFIHITRESLRSIANIREAYSTIMTNNLNQVIKLFTSLTVILTIPTIVASFFGMNVKLPLQEHPIAFETIAIATLVLSLVTIAIFSYKDWL